MSAPTRSALKSEVIEVENDPEALYELSLAQKWGDGAPLIPPTDERVEALFAATPRASDEVVVAELPPKHGAATVELAAINAAMAGCTPRAFPFVLAALEAIAKPDFNGFGLTTTTAPVTQMLLVNGPTRDELAIDYREGCLGGGAGRGSMTIGRAVQLCLRNIGGMRAGDSSRTVFGQPGRFGVCFGEWEERSQWPSVAERRGYRRDQEVVTVHGAMGTMALLDIATENDKDLAYLIAKSIASPMANLYVPLMSRGEVMLLLQPMWADRFAKTFPKIESFQEFVYENAWQPIEFWPAQNQKILRDAGRVDGKGRVPALCSPDRIVPVVCGGLGNLHSTILPSWGESEMQSSVAVRPS